MDYGKFKYEQQKRESEARKKQKVIEIKEVKFRPNTDTNDYDVKMRNVFKFLETIEGRRPSLADHTMHRHNGTQAHALTTRYAALTSD